ncbi:hypothetical protein [Pseudomonas saponiphila]|nr:hypothetical protein [Pseudomonas saponiphila]
MNPLQEGGRYQAFEQPLLVNGVRLLRISEHRDRPFRLIVTGHFANA